MSLLLDQLFNLKASADRTAKTAGAKPTLLSDLVCSTNVLMKLESGIVESGQQRGQSLLASLKAYQSECRHLHSMRPSFRRANKGKRPAMATDESYAQRLSLVAQVRDLFPHLGEGYVSRLLEHYQDQVETVIACLLDGSLAPELQGLDEAEELQPPVKEEHVDTTPTPQPAPQATVKPFVPQRRNIFDNDEFDRLAVAPSKVHIGRAKQDVTADDVLADRSERESRKAAIMSALAAFEADEDERDDTYDVADVGGTVDAALPGADTDADVTSKRTQAAAADVELFKRYKANPSLFDRGAVTRRSQARAELRKETDMTDEAIEGFAMMLNRDPKRVSKLEQALVTEGLFGAGAPAQQPELKPTSYRRTKEADEGDDSAEPGSSDATRGRGGGRGRGGRSMALFFPQRECRTLVKSKSSKQGLE
ncbi:hypothetical protein KEM55_003686 [Ascosphaera atra]|nr:hypothetical protein KEM55_003686 [Ascosphaera atra]